MCHLLEEGVLIIAEWRRCGIQQCVRHCARVIASGFCDLSKKGLVHLSDNLYAGSRTSYTSRLLNYKSPAHEADRLSQAHICGRMHGVSQSLESSLLAASSWMCGRWPIFAAALSLAIPLRDLHPISDPRFHVRMSGGIPLARNMTVRTCERRNNRPPKIAHGSPCCFVAGIAPPSLHKTYVAPPASNSLILQFGAPACGCLCAQVRHYARIQAGSYMYSLCAAPRGAERGGSHSEPDSPAEAGPCN